MAQCRRWGGRSGVETEAIVFGEITSEISASGHRAYVESVQTHIRQDRAELGLASSYPRRAQHAE